MRYPGPAIRAATQAAGLGPSRDVGRAHAAGPPHDFQNGLLVPPAAMRPLCIELIGYVIARRRPVPGLVAASIVRVPTMVAVRMMPIVPVVGMRPVVPDTVPVIVPMHATAASVGNRNDAGGFRRVRWLTEGRGIGRHGAKAEPESAD
jgi:hypothetical protein